MNVLFFLSLVFTISITFPGRALARKYTKYSGLKLYKNSVLHAYYFNNKVGVLEKGRRGGLLNCEFFTSSSDQERKSLLKNVDSRNIHKASFDEISQYLDQCGKLDTEKINKIIRKKNANLLKRDRSAFSLAIAPGTRWCGKGNSASSYYALGKFVEIDKCCRIHDNCPISINGGATEYGVKNDGKITLSDCTCDDRFKHCLKNEGSKKSTAVGKLFFNILKIRCLDRASKKIRKAIKY